MQTVPSHVLILGCGRSGTSIFGELFERFPGYTYYSEPPFDTVAGLSFSTPVAIKVPAVSKGYAPSPGLSFPLDDMLSVLPEPRKLYWQVRHPLDAIASLRVGIAQDWGHHPRPPDWESWVARPLIERCAHHWNYVNSIGYAQVRDRAQVCRFEDMLADPHGFATTIAQDVGAEPTGLEAWSERVQDTNNERFVEAKTSRRHSRPDHTHKVGRWRENFTNDELEQVVPMVREAAAAFGYAL